MALLIDRELLRNTTGFLTMYINEIQNNLTTLDNIKASKEDMALAETRINKAITNFNKLINVIITKGQLTPTNLKFSDSELRSMNVMK